MKIGYFLSSEEWGPRELVAQAVKAQAAGFEGLWISDHFHPWNGEQGHSPFVWATIGAIANAIEMKVTTAVTCPTVRLHPAIVAQAAATSAVLLDGRFCLVPLSFHLILYTHLQPIQHLNTTTTHLHIHHHNKINTQT